MNLLDMKPTGHYSGGEPIYSFPTSFPSKGVRCLDAANDTPEAALERGKKYIQDYEAQNRYAHMGQCLGVTLKDGKYYAVINTYYSNT